MNTKQMLVTILIIATVITTGINPATAQRRSTGITNTETREQTQPAQRNVDSNNTRSSASGNERSNTRNSQTTTTRQNTNREATRPAATRSNPNTQRQNNATRQQNNTTRQQNNVTRQTNRNQPNNSPAVRSENNTNRRNNTASPNTRRNEYSRPVTNPNARQATENARRIYRLDENDSRYNPRGNSRYWSQNDRPGSMNYNRNDRDFYRNYDYMKYNHWNSQWEEYRWNLYSWRDYYSAYNPHSYLFHRYYVHHPVYGHVIRKFTVRPVIFNHNGIKYYCYDGHFFRRVRGIGYVLVDIPFGMTFDSLPRSYERVHINGDLYFRIGNIFFERTNFGFVLIHYPERYYSLDDGFRNEGYYFDDDIYW